MPSQEAQCFFSSMFGEKGFSKAVDDSVVEKSVRDPHSKATYARHRSNYDATVSRSAPWTPKEGFAPLFEKYTGVPLHEVSAFFRNPDAILGEQLTSRMESLYLEHIQQHGSDAKEVWASKYRPQVKALKEEFLAQAPPLYQDYASKYFSFHERGGQLYSRAEWENPVSDLARNAVGNLVAWNPGIAIMNVFEYTPKALAYAIEVAGPVKGPAAVMKAMASYFNRTGFNLAKRVDEYDQLGIYGVTKEARKFDLTTMTENPLRGLSAELSKILGRPVTEGVERVAFINRFGNEVQAFWTRSGADTVALMRFAISANKFYMNLISQASKGNVNAAIALAAFSGMTAIQTGGISALPAPVAFAMKYAAPEMLDAIKEFDEESKLNISSQLGMDIAEKVQPLGGAAFGVGYSIATQDVTGGLKSIAKAPGDFIDGDNALGTARLVEGMLGVGQVAKIPGVNLTTKRLVRAIEEQLENEQELNLEGLAQEAAIQTGLNTRE